MGDKRVNGDLNCHDVITSEEYVDIAVRSRDFLKKAQELKAECIQVGVRDWAMFHIKVDPRECQEFYLNQEYVLITNLYGLSSISSMEISGVTPILQSESLDLTGNGVLIGIIDTGIDYTHEAFINEDGTSKIINIWDQTQRGTPPSNLLYGTEYTKEQINEAIKSQDPLSIVPSIDDIGHGTFLAGLAVGKLNEEENFQGAAPGAELIIVKLKRAKKCLIDFFKYRDDAIAYQSIDILQGANYLIAKAAELNRPLIMLLTAVTSDGPHNGTNEEEKYLASLGDNYGVIVITSAGNEANKAHHFHGRFMGKEKTASMQLNIGENEKGVYINMWNPLPDKFAVEFISPKGNATGIISYKTKQWSVKNLPLEKSIIRVYYDLSEERTAEQAVAIIIENPDPGLWTIVVHGEIIVNGKFDAYLPIDGFISKDTYFLRPNPYETIAIPSTNLGTISVGAYNDITGSIYLPSGRGYTRDNKVKPDIVAPGVNVKSTLPGNAYGVMSGTSISAAITAGASALIMEWGVVKGNDLTINTVTMKTYLARGGRRKEGFNYPNREWGYGELDLLSTFGEI